MRQPTIRAGDPESEGGKFAYPRCERDSARYKDPVTRCRRDRVLDSKDRRYVSGGLEDLDSNGSVRKKETTEGK